jgi:glycosyltransferase involved in cell wall biosynthesis
MGPELFKARLRQLTPEPICDDWDTVECQSRPDLAYILALSLPQDTTGYAMRTQSLVLAMKQQGVNIHCLTRPGFPWNRGFEGPPGQEIVGTITYHRSGDAGHRIPNDLASFCTAERELVTKLKKLRPKMVMAASNHGTAIPAFFAARRLGLPFVYDVRGFWELSRALREPEWGKSDAFVIACELETLVTSEADLVLTLTSSMQRELERRGVDGRRIRIVPNAADPDQFIPRPRSAKLAQKLGIPQNVPVIGYVGSFNFYEGLNDLVAAVTLLAKRGHDFRMLLIGSDSHPHIPIADSLRRQAEQNGIGSRLILPGQIAAEEVAEWYSLIDIAPIPRKEVAVTQLVSPIKPLEAMAMGKAVVVSDLAPLAEIVRHGSTGLTYPAGRNDALAQALELLLQDSDLRKRLGLAARAWVVNNRTWHVVASSISLACNELIQ